MLSQLFRRKPIVALLTRETTGHLLERVLLPPHAWEQFGSWLVAGLVCYAPCGYRHSRLYGA